MTTRAQQAGALGDGLALLRAYLADDRDGASRLIARLDPGEVLLVLGGLVQIGAGLLQDVARITADDTDQLLDHLLADLHRRTT